MVITEAMSQGLPVITTENTAGADLIQQGRNGFLVPIRDTDSLAEVMQWCLEHRTEVLAMGQEAVTTAKGWQWSHYRSALGRVISKFLLDSDATKGTVGCSTGN